MVEAQKQQQQYFSHANNSKSASSAANESLNEVQADNDDAREQRFTEPKEAEINSSEQVIVQIDQQDNSEDDGEQLNHSDP